MSKDLHALIISLSQTEKRYFKVYASQHVVGDKNNYVELFDAINKQTAYDEQDLLERFKGEKWIARLPAEKNYLSRLILKSMRSYRSESTLKRKAHNLLLDCQFLYDKALFGRCEKLLQKALRLAAELELFNLWLEMLNFEKKLIKANSEKMARERLLANEAAIREVMAELRAYHATVEVRDQLFALVRGQFGSREGEVEAGLLTTDSRAILQASLEAPGFLRRSVASAAFAMFHQLEGNYRQALEFYSQTIAVWEAHPKQIKDSTNNYKIALSNLLTALHMNGKLERFPEVIEKIRKLPQSNPKEEIESRHNVLFYELLYHLNKGTLEEGLALVPEIESMIGEEEGRINMARILALMVNVTFLYWIAGEAKLALKWAKNIVGHAGGSHRKDIVRLGRILEVILQYELGNYELIEYFFRSHYRHLKRNADLDSFEKIVLRTIRYLPDKDGLSEVRESLSRLDTQLEKLKPETGNSHILGLEEVRFWIQAELEGRSLREVIYGVGGG